MKNDFEILGETTVIFLKRRNGNVMSTYIDTVDLEEVKTLQGSWYANYHKKSQTYYVMANIKNDEGKKTLIGLHRFIMNSPKDKVVDHIDRNTLNNKRNNLRVVTQAQNNQNMRIQKNNKSGIRGVHWSDECQSWRTRVKLNGKYHSFGNYKDIKEAEKAVLEGRENLLLYAKE